MLYVLCDVFAAACAVCAVRRVCWVSSSCQRLLRVERAFPVREAVGANAENDGINVEMDPEDQFKVGWCLCWHLLSAA